MNKTYNTLELAKILNVSDRTVRRYLNNYISFNNGSFEVSEKMLNVLKTDILGQPTDSIGQSADTFDRTEYFSNEEYNEFQKRLIEYPILKEQNEALKNDIIYHKNRIEYHDKSLKNHLEQQAITLKLLQQRSFIEAKEKGFDN